MQAPIRTAAAVAAAAWVLAGCATSSEPPVAAPASSAVVGPDAAATEAGAPDAAAPTSSPAPPPPRSTDLITPDERLGFIAFYKERFPELTAGRSDDALDSDARGVCLDMYQGREEASLIDYLIARSESGDSQTLNGPEASVLLEDLRARCEPPPA